MIGLKSKFAKTDSTEEKFKNKHRIYLEIVGNTFLSSSAVELSTATATHLQKKFQYIHMKKTSKTAHI